MRLEVQAFGVAASVQILRRVSGSFVTLRCVASGTETSDLEWTFAGGVTTYIMVGLDESADPAPPGAVTLTIPNDPVTPTPPWAVSGTQPSAPLPPTATVEPGRPPAPHGPDPWWVGVIVAAAATGFVAIQRRAGRRAN